MSKTLSVKRNAALPVMFSVFACLFLLYAGSHARANYPMAGRQQGNANKQEKAKSPKNNNNANSTTPVEAGGADEHPDATVVSGQLADAEKALDKAKRALEATDDLVSKSGLGDSITNNSTFSEADDEATRKLDQLGGILNGIVHQELMGKLKEKHDALKTARAELSTAMEKLPDEKDDNKIEGAQQQEMKDMRESRKKQAKSMEERLKALRTINNDIQKKSKAIPSNVSDLIDKLIKTKIGIFMEDKEGKGAEALMKELPEKLGRFQQGLRLRHDYQNKWKDIASAVATLSASPVIEDSTAPGKDNEDEKDKNKKAQTGSAGGANQGQQRAAHPPPTIGQAQCGG